MRPLAHLPTVFDDEDLIGVANRRHALGHDDRHRVSHHRDECRAQVCVGGEVERRERIVEEINARVPDERAGDGQPLSLAAGDVRSALRYDRVEPAGHRRDESHCLGHLERGPQLLVGRIGVGVTQIAGDAAGEEIGLLGHETDSAPEQLGLDVSDVDAVHKDLAAGGIEQPRHQIQQRGLAGAGATDDGDRLTRPGAEGDVAQHRILCAGILELDVAEFE